MTVVSRRKKRLNGSSRHGYVICILEVYRDMPSALYFIVTTPGLQSTEIAIVLQSIEMTSTLHSTEMIAFYRDDINIAFYRDDINTVIYRDHASTAVHGDNNCTFSLK